MRRYAPLKPSTGTRWPPKVRAHVRTHQPECIGPLVGMPGECAGQSEDDHIRASGAIGKKSLSIATNDARLCGAHHRLKTEAGKEWRPRLISVIRALYGNCAWCQVEDAEHWNGGPLARRAEDADENHAAGHEHWG